MALAANKYEKVNDSLGKKLMNLSADSIGVILMNADHVPNFGATGHQFLSDVKASGTEASGTGYTAGGATLTGVTWTQTSGVWALKGTIPAWDTTGGSLSAAYAVFFDKTPSTDATRPVLCIWNLAGDGSAVTSTNGSFALTQNAAGIFTLD